MAHIHIDEKIISNVRNENLISVIQDIIKDELNKPESDIDADFIEECVNSILKIEQAEDNSFVPLVPLIKRQDFVDRIVGKHNGVRNVSKMARVAIIAAALAASTVTANAAVEAVTGVNIIEQVGERVQNKLESWGIIKEDTDIDVVADEEDGKEGTEKTTTQVNNSISQHTTMIQSATVQKSIENKSVGFDNDEETTTKETTTQKPETKPTTTNKYIPPTTEKAVTEAYKPEKEVVMTGLRAEYDNRFKSDYIYGEKLSYEGMTLTAVFSDGSEQHIRLSDCSYTSGIDMNKTGDYTLVVTYKNATVRTNITVRPDEETRGSKICGNDEYDYLLTDCGAYITGYKGGDADIVLNEIDGEAVIAISAGVFAGNNMQSITCENVKKIFDNAFKDCKALISVVAPELEYIGNSAFEGCTRLEKAVLSSSLIHIGEKAYKDSGITQITIPQGITEIPVSLCENCDSLETVAFDGEVITIDSFAFSECNVLERVTGTEKIRSVRDYAFYNDTFVDFDSALPFLEVVGNYAFAYCNEAGITKIGDNIKEIGQYAFAYCYNLKEVEIPAGIKVIQEGTFRGAHISKLTLHEGVEVIDDCAFMSTEIVTLQLPRSLKRIGSYGLYSIKLKEVYFGKNIEYIGSSAFYKRNNLMFYLYDNTVPFEYAIANSINYIINEED